MKSGVPWQVSGVRRAARETAREAARRAGLSIGEWLDAVILDSAEHDESESKRRGARESSHDEEPSDRDEEARDDEAYLRPSRYAEELEERLPLARNDDPSVMHRGFSELHQRLDELTRQ